MTVLALASPCQSADRQTDRQTLADRHEDASTNVLSELTRSLWPVWVGGPRTTGVSRHTLWGFSSSEI